MTAPRIIASADDPADADVIPALIETESVTMTFYELVTERVAHRIDVEREMIRRVSNFRRYDARHREVRRAAKGHEIGN